MNVFDIVLLPKNTSYDRIYKKIVRNLTDRFNIVLSDYKPGTNAMCSIAYESVPCALLIFMPEEEPFSEFVKKSKSDRIQPYASKIKIPLVLCHENTCFFVWNNKELSLQRGIELIKQAGNEIGGNIKKTNDLLIKSLSEQFQIKETDFNKYIIRNGRCYTFTSDFYDLVFGKTEEVETISRYSSLRSFFDILNNKSIRMCSLVGMNDPSEGALAYDYIHSDSSQKNNKAKDKRNKVLNDSLILSFCEGKEKFDELTQWRLYGDNAKGVCCEYELDGVLPDAYIFKKTIYESDKSYETLEKLKKICDTVKTIDSKFFVDTTILYSFFKLDAYSIENEIRLMYKVKDDSELKWMLTQDHSIINAYKDFQLKDFPLKLKRVVLGPLMPDIETNKYQIKRMLECVASQVKGLEYLRYVEVEKSTIDCYR